jgi:hypothetical protein
MVRLHSSSILEPMRRHVKSGPARFRLLRSMTWSSRTQLVLHISYVSRKNRGTPSWYLFDPVQSTYSFYES